MGNVAKRGGEIIIREMAEEDIEAVLAIDGKISGELRAVTYADMPSSYLGGELAVSLVAETGGEVIGFVLGRIVDSPYGRADTGWFQLIGVDPGYWRQGIGTKLMEAFIEHCRARDIDAIRTMVSWHDWLMLSFLRSLGFSRGDMAEFEKRLR